MYGLQKGTVNINLVNATTNSVEPVNVITPATADGNGLNGIYASQCKSFVRRVCTFDPNVPAANVAATITDRIDSFSNAYGARYDDIVVTINTTAGGLHDIMVLITRNFS